MISLKDNDDDDNDDDDDDDDDDPLEEEDEGAEYDEEEDVDDYGVEELTSKNPQTFNALDSETICENLMMASIKLSNETMKLKQLTENQKKFNSDIW